jgi:hypothetical protein
MSRTWVLLLSTVLVCSAQTPDGVEFFEKRIRPVLAAKCYACHSASAAKVQGGLLVDSRDGLRKGGNSGQPAVTPNDAAKSLLLTAVKRTGALKMPPGPALAPEVIADFEQWIAMGAPDPRDAKTAALPPYNYTEARKFWSFQPVRDPAPPRITDTAWNKTAIDRFIKSKLDEKKLTPLPAASKRVLIRRATYDLTGLPPTPGEVETFLKDNSAAAFEKVVDRLLASPHYGERWGRHWLDVARYADTSGCNSDYPIADMYRYRNWMIRAFNADMPYTEFIREQIAGDILAAEAPADRDTEARYAKIVATGYLANSRRFGSRNAEFNLTIDDTIDNAGKAILGLSISCARCHDHKFDPIPNRDYYALYGIFQSTKYAFPGTEIYPHAKDFTPLASGEDASKLTQYQEETSKLDEVIEDYKSGRMGKGLSPEQKNKEMQSIHDRVAVLESRFPETPKAYAVMEGAPANARIQLRGDPKNLGDEVPRAWLTVLGGDTLPTAEKGSGRLELAEWLTADKNPLTARVMVNRIWQHHFGKGIVQTPNDFGARGDRPTHPELLDYLAVRFRESRYSVKAMHKLIMLTRAYQTSSGDNARDAAVDPRNAFLWRFDRRRLDAEEIRDAMLAISGALDPAMGGPHPFPPEIKWKYTQHRAFVGDYETNKRSVYLMQQRIKKQPFLETFDGADTNASTAKRTANVTAIQALTMMNSQFVYDRADELAVRVGMAHDTEPARIDAAFRLAFGRPAAQREIQEGVQYLRAAREDYGKAGTAPEKQARAALASYLRVLLASDEFVYID